MQMISGFCLTGFIVYEMGYRLNFTHSVPVDLTEKIMTVNGRKTSEAMVRAISAWCPWTCSSLRNYS